MWWALVPLIRNASFKVETSILQIRVFKVKAWGPQLILGNPGGNVGGRYHWEEVPYLGMRQVWTGLAGEWSSPSRLHGTEAE